MKWQRPGGQIYIKVQSQREKWPMKNYNVARVRRAKRGFMDEKLIVTIL